VITWVYAVTVVLSAPVHIVVSRFAADRLFERRLEALVPPLRRALAATLLAGSVLGAALMTALDVAPVLRIPGTVLATVVAAQWLLMAVGSGLALPAVVIRAFAGGAAASLILGPAIAHRSGPPGYLWGFSAGQVLTLVLLLWAVFDRLPAEGEEEERLAPAFRRYATLAASALAYQLAMWVDKLIAVVLTGVDAAWDLTTASAAAWFSVVPTFAWLYVSVETTFYERFREYFDAVEGGAPLSVLRQRASALKDEVVRLLSGGAALQLSVCAFALAAGPYVLARAGAPAAVAGAFRLVLVGVALQVLTFAGLLVLYYLDLRRAALVVTGVLLGGAVIFALAAHALDLPLPIGYVAGSALAAATVLIRVRLALRDLLLDTFQSQSLEVAS
jgi:uncharacterized membrane protein